MAVLAAAALLVTAFAVPAKAAPPTSFCPYGRGEAYNFYNPAIGFFTANTACQWLDTGQSWAFGDGKSLTLSNGNLRIHTPRVTYWKSDTEGSGATQMVFQHDGNLVLYTPGWARAVWASGTDGDCASYEDPMLAIQPDGNMVIYCYSFVTRQIEAVWDTGTW
jgi:hypothetical protein